MREPSKSSFEGVVQREFFILVVLKVVSSQGGIWFMHHHTLFTLDKKLQSGLLNGNHGNCLESVEVVYQPSHKRWPTRSTV